MTNAFSLEGIRKFPKDNNTRKKQNTVTISSPPFTPKKTRIIISTGIALLLLLFSSTITILSSASASAPAFPASPSAIMTTGTETSAERIQPLSSVAAAGASPVSSLTSFSSQIGQQGQQGQQFQQNQGQLKSDSNAGQGANGMIPPTTPTPLQTPQKQQPSAQQLQPVVGILSFGSIKNLSNNPGDSGVPVVETSGNNVYVVWQDKSTGNGDVYFKRSIDGGNNFGSTKNLSNNPGESFNPTLAKSGSNVYVAWSDKTTGTSDIYLKRSIDGGANFGNL